MAFSYRLYGLFGDGFVSTHPAAPTNRDGASYTRSQTMHAPIGTRNRPLQPLAFRPSAKRTETSLREGARYRAPSLAYRYEMLRYPPITSRWNVADIVAIEARHAVSCGRSCGPDDVSTPLIRPWSTAQAIAGLA